MPALSHAFFSTSGLTFGALESYWPRSFFSTVAGGATVMPKFAREPLIFMSGTKVDSSRWFPRVSRVPLGGSANPRCLRQARLHRTLGTTQLQRRPLGPSAGCQEGRGTQARHERHHDQRTSHGACACDLRLS